MFGTLHAAVLQKSTLRNSASPNIKFVIFRPSLADFGRRQMALRPEMEQCTVYSAELEALQKLLHFPEEVAIKLTQTEHALFCKVKSPGSVLVPGTLSFSI